MRILHVTPYWADAWAYGGIPRVVGAFVRALARAGHDVTVCATDAYDRSGRLAPPARPAERAAAAWPPFRTPEGVVVRIFPNRSNHLAYTWQAFAPVGLSRYLRDHALDFDVAHLHACRNLPGAIAAHWLDRYRVPYVVQPNGTAPILERRRAAKRLFDLVAGRRVLHGAAAIVAVSGAEREQLRALGVPDDRIRTLPNPVDLAEFDAPIVRGAFRRRMGLGDAPVVTCLAKFTPRKRADLLVQAFAALDPATHLVLAGSDMGGLTKAMARARRLGVADRVRMIGPLYGPERLEALADADVVAYAADDEVFGLVAIESLLAGTPVVVASDSGCGDIVSAIGGGPVVPAGDGAELARALAAVQSAPGEWRARAAAAAARARDLFGADRVTRSLLDVYADVAGAPSRALPADVGGLAAGASAQPQTGVSVIVPVRNGMATLARTLDSIDAQRDGRPMEVLAVDDGSEDGSAEWLQAQADEGRLRLFAGDGRGPSAAMNRAISAARHPVICQVDQDVMLLPGWMARLVEMLDRDPRLGAVQGHYTVDPRASLVARAMAIDLEQRYDALAGGETTHVCTGNTAYRADAIRAAGLFDEAMGYANDNDLSRRLRRAGWRLGHCARARSLHAWREGPGGYWRQQYGFGYGRLDLVARDLREVAGDRVSPWPMMAHPLVMLAAMVALTLAVVLAVAGLPWRASAAAGVTALAVLALERAIAGIRAWWRFGHAAALVFPALHFWRDTAWVAAIGVWTLRRVAGTAPRAAHSIRPRRAEGR